MAGRDSSIYQTARKEARLTQEQAAEQLGVSVETVKAWEQGQRVPRPEDVERMQSAYGTPWLGLAYTRATCGRLGAVPEVTRRELPEAVLALINRDSALGRELGRLTLIAEDGQVDAQEEEVYQQIRSVIMALIAACFAVLYAETPPGAKSDRPAAGTTERSEQRIPRACTTLSDKNIIPQNRGLYKPQIAREGVTFP